jgi:hypothetical protein
MGKVTLLALGGALLSAPLLAQESNAFDGRWGGTLPTRAGGSLIFELVLDGSSGTWQYFLSGPIAREFPCLAARHAVTVRQRSATELRFSVDASKTMAGCQDGRAVVRIIDAQHLEGTTGDGARSS